MACRRFGDEAFDNLDGRPVINDFSGSLGAGEGAVDRPLGNAGLVGGIDGESLRLARSFNPVFTGMTIVDAERARGSGRFRG